MIAAGEVPRLLVSGGTTSVPGLLAITVVGFAFALGTPAAAHPLYDTERVLAHTDNECLTLPENKCRTIASPQMSLGAGAVTTVELACVREFPYVVAWDAEHHEHIGLALVSAPPDRSAVVTAATVAVEPESVTVHATNQADARGSVTLFIGCAAKPVVDAPFPQSRYGLPSKRLRSLIEE